MLQSFKCFLCTQLDTLAFPGVKQKVWSRDLISVSALSSCLSVIQVTPPDMPRRYGLSLYTPTTLMFFLSRVPSRNQQREWVRYKGSITWRECKKREYSWEHVVCASSQIWWLRETLVQQSSSLEGQWPSEHETPRECIFPYYSIIPLFVIIQGSHWDNILESINIL